jgi:hypothetical protein
MFLKNALSASERASERSSLLALNINILAGECKNENN